MIFKETLIQSFSFAVRVSRFPPTYAALFRFPRLSFIPPVPYPLPKYRHPERSRGIFIALSPYAHMCPHSNDTLVLPFSPFPCSRFTGLQEGSLHFGRDDRWKTGNLT